MPLKLIFLFCILSLTSGIWTIVFAQTLPAVPKIPDIEGGLFKGIPSGGAGLESLVAKPEIPYLKELKQIQSLKQSYDSLKSELKEIKEHAKDSTQRDSLLIVAKERGREVLEKESRVLKSLIESEDIPGDEIKNVSARTLEVVNASKERLSEIQNFEGLEALLDQNEENLKALTNEWFLPKVEQVLSGTLEGTLDPTQAKISDFYGKGALEKLVLDGSDPKDLMWQAKEQAMGKARHISDDYFEKLDGNFSKLKLDSLGNVEVLLDPEKRKFKLIEPNALKGSGFLERTGLLLWYDPLTSFKEGFFAEAGMSFGFTHQLQGFGAWTVKRSSDNISGPRIVGQGPKLGVRFSKGNWVIQSALSHHQITMEYPAGYESRNFSGKQWAGELALVRTIPMGKSLSSVVMVSWDPLYQEGRSLAGSGIQMKIGFELGRLKGLKQELKPELDQMKPDQKIPEGKIKGIESVMPTSPRVK